MKLCQLHESTVWEMLVDTAPQARQRDTERRQRMERLRQQKQTDAENRRREAFVRARRQYRRAMVGG